MSYRIVDGIGYLKWRGEEKTISEWEKHPEVMANKSQIKHRIWDYRRANREIDAEKILTKPIERKLKKPKPQKKILITQQPTRQEFVEEWHPKMLKELREKVLAHPDIQDT